MAVSDEVRAMCIALFAPKEIDSALRVLDTYDGEEADRVHRAVVALSSGDLYRLASWVDGVTPPLDQLFWIAGAMQPDATEKQVAAARWLNSFYDKHRLASPEEAG
ncbi:hypothetical protein [Kitasatospora sp. SUK 42]|uniref:hypothetical protein n=1 Tax=Kitasatospora sp. SUK 42 TaxID=1588882 RepID=UPI0018CB57BB|nr:hypothetical protein [Kitasatospora sp. SUK 42]MBV2154657.1 hypothetical protein [Kitasatospora sp. SUK 42]